MANARKMAVVALLEVDRDLAYSNLTLNKILMSARAEENDRALATALFYGVLDRRITLDYVLSGFMKAPLKRVAPFTLEVLRTALYQIMFMERIPQSAAVNESVKLIKSSPEQFNASFVNAVLRSILRKGVVLPEGNSVRTMSIRYSCPEWIIKSFTADYGIQNAVGLLAESLTSPPVNLRVNTTRTTPNTLMSKLREQGVSAVPCNIPDAIVVEGGIDVRGSALYRHGFFHVQDAASQISIARLAPKPGEHILDLCAAPGGKSFTMAEMMDNKGSISAFDLYEKRVQLIRDGADRLGLSVITPAVSDASVFRPELEGQFDAVLCDVPCSGLGVLRRKPEIKYKSPQSFAELEGLQSVIFSNAGAYLKPGGRMLYSTCTLRRAENEDAVHTFLDKQEGFALKYEHTFFPHIDKTDGFYCALIEKSR